MGFSLSPAYQDDKVPILGIILFASLRHGRGYNASWCRAASKVTNGIVLTTKELTVAPTTGFHCVMVQCFRLLFHSVQFRQ
jgi:hypothetical protein